MDPRVRRGLAAALVVGGLGAAIVNVPSRWYGATPGDSHVFDPPLFSPLWVERVVVPAASVVVGALLLVGLFGLVYRDRERMGRLPGIGGVAALFGLAILEVAQTVIHATAPGTVATLTAFVAILAALVGVALLAIGLVVLGIGYVRAGAPRLGYALLGGPLASVGITAVGVVTGVGTADGVAAIVPLALAFVAAGYDLWHRGEPVATAATDAAGTDRGAT